MVKLVLALAVAGALAAGVYAVPIRGRTIADRWHVASGPAEFASGAWNEAQRAMHAESRTAAPPLRPSPDARGARPQQRSDATRRPGAARPAGPAPVEHHSAEDRAALERLLSERSR